jgi:hypothetical protein
MRAYRGDLAEDIDIEALGRAQSEAAEEALKPVMRWTMIKREGSVWTSWRPGESHCPA